MGVLKLLIYVFPEWGWKLFRIATRSERYFYGNAIIGIPWNGCSGRWWVSLNPEIEPALM